MRICCVVSHPITCSGLRQCPHPALQPRNPLHIRRPSSFPQDVAIKPMVIPQTMQRTGRPDVAMCAGFNLPNPLRSNKTDSAPAPHSTIAMPPVTPTEQQPRRPDVVVFAGFQLPTPHWMNRPAQDSSMSLGPDARTRIQSKPVAPPAKQQSDPTVRPALPTASLNADPSSLAENMVTGSLHLLLVMVWLAALFMTTSVAARFVTVSHVVQPTARMVTARGSSVLATALASLLGGLLRLAVRVFAVNMDMLRVMSIGFACCVMNHITSW